MPDSVESATTVKVTHKTKLEKSLIVVSILLVLAVLGLLIYLIVLLTQPTVTPEPSENICYTETCVERSLWIMRAIDNKTDPCDDFYQYACGKWMADTEIPADRSRVGTFDSIGDNVNKMLNKSLSSRVVDPNKPNENAQNKAAFMYQRCLVSDSSSESNIYAALQTIVDGAGGCGLLTPGWSDTRGRSTVMATIQSLTQDAFLSLYVYPDLKDSSRNRITISQPALLLSIKSRYESTNVEPYITYRQLVNDTFTILRSQLNSTLSDTDFNTQIEEMLDFERKLAEVTFDPDEIRDESKTYSLIKMRELSALYKDVINLLVSDLVSKSVDDDEQIQLILGPNFLETYEKVLQATSTRALANYGIWAMIYDELFDSLPESMRNLEIKLTNLLQGSNPPARWRACLTLTTEYLDFGIGRLYIDEHFDKEIKNDMSNLVEYVAAEFLRESLQNNNWIDAETKSRAVNKLNTMGREVAFPDFIVDDAKLNKYYADITLPSGNNALFINILRDAARGMSVRIMNEWVTLAADRKAWAMGPQTVNAFYSPNTNSIYFPGGFLYPPFYHRDLPKSMNYGGIGQVIGHEISHGFDDMGRQYDEYGNMENWWTNQSIAQFNTRADCVIKQYSESCFPQIPQPNCINGEFTQGENIADIGGLRTAYEAYRQWKKTNLDIKLPGLTHYSDEQLLFLTLSHVLCTKMTQQRLISNLATDPHSQTPYRVNVNLQNLEQFSEVWQCKPGSKMNPTSKCRVW